MDDDRNISIAIHIDDRAKWENVAEIEYYADIEELNKTLSESNSPTMIMPKGFLPNSTESIKILVDNLIGNPKVGLVFADFSYNGVDFHCSARYSNGIGFIPFIIKSGLNVSFNGNVGDLVEQVKKVAIVHSIPEVMFEHND